MDFSVIVAFNNSYELMTHFLENLLRTTNFSRGELILVSDGCRDSCTLSFIRERTENFAWFHLIELERQVGYSKANNAGVHCSCGKILIFLNSDTFPTQGSINLLVCHMQTSAHIGAAQGKLIYPQNGLIQSTGHLFMGYSNAHVYAGCQREHPLVQQYGIRQALTTAFCSISRQEFDRHGGFDESYYNAYEGMELTFKITNSGKHCVYFPDASAFHAVGGSRNYIDFDDRTPGHIFWERWKQVIKTDIQTYLKPQITDEMRGNTYFLIQGSSNPCWAEVINQLELRLSGELALQSRFSGQIDLYRNLPFAALEHPQPYLFVVNDLSRIRGNQNWAEVRNVPNDLVMDEHGLVRSLFAVTGIDRCRDDTT